MNKTKRVKIVIGLKCNIQCVFCYYRDNLQTPNRAIAEIRKDLIYARRHGIEEVDFSGGEPTVHPGLPQLIFEAKSIGMQKVCIISNGWRLADREYLRSLQEAGLDEILFSVHGSSPAVHDELTATPRSFERITAALGHAAGLGLTVRTNTVVNRVNLDDLDSIGRFIGQFRPAQVNFITINDWCFAKHLVERYMVRYTEMAPRLHAVCDLLEPSVPAVNVRYIPFCFMEGHERFVCNHRQVPYDPYEWVPWVRARLEFGTGLPRYLAILGYGLLVGGAARHLFRICSAELLDAAVTEGLRHRFYVMTDSCRRCRYVALCDGVEKTYAREYGLDELNPVAGPLLSDPVTFRRGNFAWCVS